MGEDITEIGNEEEDEEKEDWCTDIGTEEEKEVIEESEPYFFID